jgi:hypothetical protein
VNLLTVSPADRDLEGHRKVAFVVHVAIALAVVMCVRKFAR